VDASGSRQVFPNSTTTYRIVAAGPGGTADASRSVTVLPPSERPPEGAAKPLPPGFAERIAKELTDIYFDYDSSEVREDSRATLQRIVDALKSILRDFPNETLQIEGHCDERGSAEYNLGLGDRRATSVKEFLVSLGVDAGRLKNVSYGKERPQCSDSTEDCWQRNRRAHFAPGQ
jgi:peptidoglycan-associated lipoprotein